MARALDTNMAAALADGVIYPAILMSLTFNSGTQYIWSGIGNLVYNGNTYLGVGSLGSISPVSEGTDVKADGMTVTLSGIDPVYLASAMNDIQLGAPATIWFALFYQGTTMIGSPYMLFNGQVDQPTISIDPGSVTITLALENELVNLQRGNRRRYTSADQRLYYPDDTAFGWVEQLNDIALVWGT